MYCVLVLIVIQFTDNNCCEVAMLNLRALLCLMQLLMKDPSKRLGSNGASEVQAHPLFKSIDWKRLEAGKMKPLFEPDVCILNLLASFLL